MFQHSGKCKLEQPWSDLLVNAFQDINESCISFSGTHDVILFSCCFKKELLCFFLLRKHSCCTVIIYFSNGPNSPKPQINWMEEIRTEYKCSSTRKEFHHLEGHVCCRRPCWTHRKLYEHTAVYTGSVPAGGS